MSNCGFVRLALQVELHWRAWGGECVLYNATTGQTHLLEQPGADLFALIAEAPCAHSELCEHLLAGRPELAAELAEEYVREAVARFVELGLVEVIDSGA